MNIKSVKFRVTNKKLKAKLKEYKHVMSSKDKAYLSLSARKDVASNLISHLKDNIEMQRNENKYLEKEKIYILDKYNDLLQYNLALERDLELLETEIMNIKELAKKYKENIHRLSINVAKLTKENESFKKITFKNKLKNLLGVG